MYFFQPDLSKGTLKLENEEFQHCVKVLRKKEGDAIGIMDGKGIISAGTIISISKRELSFEIINQQHKTAKPFSIHIAIAPTKSMDRMEWFVEKAGELGVDEITFLTTNNSERPRLKLDRLEKKTISALKQSKSGFLTQLNPLLTYSNFMKLDLSKYNKSIATVGDNIYFAENIINHQHELILIGPEGDFSESEVQVARDKGFQSVSLGHNVLRTETAGIIVAQIVNTINKY